ERIGGMTTLPLASAMNACSTTSIASRSRCTTLRSSASVRIVTSCGIGASLDCHGAQPHVASADDVGEGGHVYVAAGDDRGDRSWGRRKLAGEQRGDADHARALGHHALLMEKSLHQIGRAPCRERVEIWAL